MSKWQLFTESGTAWSVKRINARKVDKFSSVPNQSLVKQTEKKCLYKLCPFTKKATPTGKLEFFPTRLMVFNAARLVITKRRFAANMRIHNFVWGIVIDRMVTWFNQKLGYQVVIQLKILPNRNSTLFKTRFWLFLFWSFVILFLDIYGDSHIMDEQLTWLFRSFVCICHLALQLYVHYVLHNTRAHLCFLINKAKYINWIWLTCMTHVDLRVIFWCTYTNLAKLANRSCSWVTLWYHNSG